MGGISGLDWKPLQQPFVNRPAIEFFGGLKAEHQCTIKVPGFGQVLRGAQKHGRMAIDVPARGG